MVNKVAVIAAHPDDEVLGCGGTIAKHAVNGDEIQVIFLADGESSRSGGVLLNKRKDAARSASAKLGAKEPIFLDFPDNQLDSLPLLEIVQALEEVLLPFESDIIYTHHGGDLNIDHQICHRAVLTASRPQPLCSIKAIYSFEVLSSTGWNSNDSNTDFRPTYFVDIDDTFLKKMQALESYSEEMREFPHARSIKAVESLAEFRGSTIGRAKAEAFSVVRQIG
jgi:LmbE family N-acetylglucosaminyl deacetylase